MTGATSTTRASTWAPKSPDQDQAADWQNGRGQSPNRQDWGEELPKGYIQERLGFSDVHGPESSRAADPGERHKDVFQALKDIIARVTHPDRPVRNPRLRGSAQFAALDEPFLSVRIQGPHAVPNTLPPHLLHPLILMLIGPLPHAQNSSASLTTDVMSWASSFTLYPQTVPGYPGVQAIVLLKS